VWYQSLRVSDGEGGLYCSIFRNSLCFCHIARNTSIFCRLWPSLSSPMSLITASQSLQWRSKVLKMSNMSNKPGFPSSVCFDLRGFPRGHLSMCPLPAASLITHISYKAGRQQHPQGRLLRHESRLRRCCAHSSGPHHPPA
jgi:hypothetical protein